MGRRRGFSLVEVVIAFAIASLALTALVRLYTASAATTQHSARTAAAIEVADNRIAALADPALLVPGGTSGRTPQGYAWQMQIAPEPDQPADAPLLLMHVAVTVTAPGDETPLVSLETQRYAPRAGTGQR